MQYIRTVPVRTVLVRTCTCIYLYSKPPIRAPVYTYAVPVPVLAPVQYTCTGTVQVLLLYLFLYRTRVDYLFNGITSQR